MRYLSKKEIAKVDDLAINKYNIQIEKLMENAGRNMARFVSKFNPKKIIIIYGKGNNGGDGLVCARHLSIQGFNVKIIPAIDKKELNKTTKKELEILNKINIKNSNIKELDNLKSGDIIIDSLIGYNINRDPKNKFAELIERSNKVKKNGVKIISFDIPSGIDASTSKKYNPYIKADYTLTLAMPKKGLQKLKNVFLVNIGIPNKIYKDLNINIKNYFKKHDIIKIS